MSIMCKTIEILIEYSNKQITDHRIDRIRYLANSVRIRHDPMLSKTRSWVFQVVIQVLI